MNVLIPMAGAGVRFKEKGYETGKPAIPTFNRRTGKKVPMVVCALLDLPEISSGGENVILVERDFHSQDGTESTIKKYFPKARFIKVDHLTGGQASTCLLAKSIINTEEELFIAGCDNGMDFDEFAFYEKKREADVLVFTFRGNCSVLDNPDAYGWMITDGFSNITDISIKRAVSEDPMKDHAVVSSFWFRRGSIFVDAAEKMIKENDRINNEFYVDQVIKHVLEMGFKAQVFEIRRYINWGTPKDYELYQKTFEYWYGFYQKEKHLLGEK